jgi:CRP-like cAMP-binding protein
MELLELIRSVEIFKGLSEAELKEIVAICQSRELKSGENLVEEGDIGEEFYLITGGSVEVVLGASAPTPRTVLFMDEGQLIGEMALIDQGRRSATVRAVEDGTSVAIIRNNDFYALCDRSTHIGYVVMHNMAADLSFKLRHLNLIMGT